MSWRSSPSKLTASQAEQVGRNGRNVDICLAAALGDLDTISKIRYPATYFEPLWSSIEPMACVVKVVRNETSDNDPAARRFATHSCDAYIRDFHSPIRTKGGARS
jgi:hypothetical protein